MARKPPPGKCVHCCNHSDKRNWDHVFPESWYPTNTPQNLEKWKIPTCLNCNKEYGVIEQELLIRLALCLDPNSSNNKGIIERAMRSIDPTKAKRQGDRRARQAKREQVRREMMVGRDIPGEGIYPGLGERWYRPVEHRAAITVRADHVRKLCEKIVRGIVYLEDGLYIEHPFDIEFFALTDSGAESFVEILNKIGQVLSREPGIIVRRAVAHEDGTSSIWEITIFGQFVMYATVTRDD